MRNNLFVCYDLMKSDKDYPALSEAISKLGTPLKIQFSMWYVSSSLTAAQAFDRLKLVIDNNDRLIVIDAKNNEMKGTETLMKGQEMLKLWCYK